MVQVTGNNQPRTALTDQEVKDNYKNINLKDNITSEAEQALINDMKLYDQSAIFKPMVFYKKSPDDTADNVFELTDADIKGYATKHTLDFDTLKGMIDDKKQEKRNEIADLIKIASNDGGV